MIHLVNYRDTYPEQTINVTSRSKTWSRQLSPFLLGPVPLYAGLKATNVENAWQYTKVYKEYVTTLLEPSETYFAWARAGWSNSYAQRYPMGKGAKPLYSYWNGKKLNYIEARKQIYIPLYSQAVRKTTAWNTLIKIHELYKDIWLLDFDVYDHRVLGYTWNDVINNPEKKCGHGFVLAMMLEGYL